MAIKIKDVLDVIHDAFIDEMDHAFDNESEFRNGDIGPATVEDDEGYIVLFTPDGRTFMVTVREVEGS